MFDIISRLLAMLSKARFILLLLSISEIKASIFSMGIISFILRITSLALEKSVAFSFVID